MRLLFVGDLHLGTYSLEKEQAICKRLLERAAKADLVVLGGDMTQAGLPEEYDRLRALYAPIAAKCIPVRGNHDMGPYLERMRPWIPSDAEVRFEPAASPVWVWTTDWFQPLEGNTRCFSSPQCLPDPYNRVAQSPVIVVQDGIGPYYFIDRNGYRFIVLDASTHRLGGRQQTWLANTVASSRLPILIFIHHNVLPAGSIYDGAMLWDRAPLIRQLIDEPRVLGIFSGHVHYNRAWDWHGKRIVTTSERGGSRFIELKDRKIASIEPLDNAESNGCPKDGAKDVSAELPLDLRYWWADGVLASNTFWTFSRGLWDEWTPPPCDWGWHDPKGPGGLSWTVPPELLPNREMWFGVNFRSTTPWQLLLERGGKEIVVGEGGPGDNLIATGSFGQGNSQPARVILRQEAPACGHASGYMVIDETPVRKFNRYP
ncbi:MAG: metallophosphoesterase [Kiritimatiellae bacterium]|nr:metallophosphoesterase [Kiritimatiellia bacterium]